jgi:short-subunit dehydrogenase
VALAKNNAYSASKYALAGWSEALQLEERRNEVHVGLVLPGFIATEGFPQEALMRSARTRWMVSTPEKAAAAILSAGPGGKAERYVPRPYSLVVRLRYLAPGIWRRIAGGMRR